MEKSRKVLENKEEYDAALERTIEIFHAANGTPEANELDNLLPLVTNYEDHNSSIPNPANI